MSNFQLVVVNDWGSGFTANLIITNTGTAPLERWQAEFDAPFTIKSVWNGQVERQEGNRYTLAAADANQAIPPGGSITVGFQAEKSTFSATAPTDLRLNGKSLSAANASVAFEVGSQWGNGFTANLTIRNTGSTPIEGWSLAFDAPYQLENVWNAQLTEAENGQYVLSDAGWNGLIPPGGSISFGLQAKQVVSPTLSLSNFELNGSPLETSPPDSVPDPSPVEPSDPSEPSDPDSPSDPEPPLDPEPPVDDGAAPSPTNPPASGDFNYGEALQKSFLFYEAQRSGPLPANNRIEWRGDSALDDGRDQNVDLSGGYYDAGDHVKFGFPMAAAMTMLSWGVREYQDGYAATQQLSHALSAIKWGTDYLLKAHVTDGNRTQAFWGQVGSGHVDHAYWGSPEAMTMDRPAFKITPQNPGTDLAAEAAAALASASIIFRPSNPGYADKLLTNAEQLYQFADQYRGKYSDAIPDAASFYNSWSGYQDELAWGAIWLHEGMEAAGRNNTDYLAKAEAEYRGGLGPWTQSWDDKSYGTAVMLAQETGKSRYKTDVEDWLNRWMPNGSIGYTPGGLAWLDQWGSNRYAANTAFLAGVYGDTVNNPGEQYTEFAESQIDYLLGDNPRNASYVVGFGNNSPKNPHHRAASGTTNIGDSAPNKHILYGALVGGPSARDDFAYRDDRTDYIANEVALDYNAAFTGSLARMANLYGGDPLSNAELNALPGIAVANL